MIKFPWDCKDCPLLHTYDLSVDDLTHVCLWSKAQVDDCDTYISAMCPLEKHDLEIRADERRKFAEWIVNGFSVDEEWYPGRIAERQVFLSNSYIDSNGYCRCNEKNILSSEDIVNEYEKEQNNERNI